MTRSQYQFTLQDPDTDELYRVGAAVRGGAAHGRRHRGRDVRPAAAQPADQRRPRTATRSPRSASRWTRSRLALTSAYGSRQVSQIFAPDDQYQVILQVAPQYQRDPAALSLLYVQSRRPASSCRSRRSSRRARRSGRCRSTTPASCRRSRCRSTSSRASRSATRWRACRRSRARRCPATVSGSFQGTAQAFQDSMTGLGLGARARDLRHLRRARHPLRELHPPDHDSLGPARRPASARC